MRITYSAPAKIILSGEHSVVYTKPAFVTAVDYHLTCTLDEGILEKIDDQINSAVHFVNQIVTSYLHKEKIASDIRPFTYTFSSTIPEGRGMGSSAAFCVALVASLFHFYVGKQFDKQVISSLAYQAEKYFHGIPSGVDVSASCYGGLIFYRKEFEFLKTISSLNFKIPKAFEERLILIDTGKPMENTKEMVALVGKRYNEDPKSLEQTLVSIEKITKRMVISIVKEDISLFGQSIIDNEKFLEDLGIVSQNTQKILGDLTPLGVGKVTGAGGSSNASGLVLFLLNSLKDLEVLKKQGITYLPFKQDVKGIHLIAAQK